MDFKSLPARKKIVMINVRCNEAKYQPHGLNALFAMYLNQHRCSSKKVASLYPYIIIINLLYQ